MRALSTTLLLGLCMGLAPSLHATVSFSSGGSSCGSDCFSASGTSAGGNAVTVTATGLSATFTNGNTGTPTVGDLSNSGTSITQYSGYGLGVCDPVDPNCAAPQHAIDNYGGRVDFVLLQLSVPMSSISLTLSPFGTTEDMDITVITGSCTTGTAGNSCTPPTLLAALQAGTVAPTQAALDNLFGTGTSNVSLTNYSTVNGTAGQSTNLTVNLTGTVGSVNWILIGASTQPYYGDGSCGYQNNNIGIGKSCSPDYFKLNGLSGTSTPEPATFGLAGIALAALGLLQRKKLLSAKS